MDPRAGHVPGLGARQGASGARHIAIIAVDDPLDPRVADYHNVPDPELVERRGIFIAEGRLVVRRLLAGSRFVARSVMVTPTALETVGPDVASRPDLPIYVVPQRVMNEIAGFNIHRGCLAIGERRTPPAWPEVAAGARRLVLLERIGDADNVGSIFRSAAAFGADAVLLDPASADPLYRKAIRTSMGASLLLPFARITTRQEDSGGDDVSDDARGTRSDDRTATSERRGWLRALRGLRDDGMVVVALTPSVLAPSLQTVADHLTNRRVALVVGHEGEGLTPEALDACELHARIPMAAGVDSINVATAAAIAMYELERSRV